MAVFEDADGGFTPTLINSLIGALNVFALTVMIGGVSEVVEI